MKNTCFNSEERTAEKEGFSAFSSKLFFKKIGLKCLNIGIFEDSFDVHLHS